MSLLDSQMENFILYDKVRTPDAYDSMYTGYVPSMTFKAVAVLDSSIEAQTALAAGVKGVYTITTRKGINLQYHDVLKRESDGKEFRVTTDGDDDKTPDSAGLNMRQVRAEEWSIPA